MEYGIERFFILAFCLACCWPGLGAKSHLRIVRQWSELQFEFPSEEARATAEANKFYVPGDSVPIDVDVHYRSGQKPRIFVTIPRFDVGRPVTLGTVDENGTISGYPDYSWHDNQGSNCYGLTSVFRVAIDRCDRLWVMDAGKVGAQAGHSCTPQLLAFDLKTDKLVYRHRVPAANYVPASLFITPVLDVRGTDPNDCHDTFVYVADVAGFGLLVVDVARDRSWRITNKLFYPFPSRGSFVIDGVRFENMDGVFGLALSPYVPGEDRFLYFHSLAATTENVVRTSVLRNDSFIKNSNADPDSIMVFPEERTNQSAAQAMDDKGILYFGIMDPPSVLCWHSDTEFSPNNFHQVAVNRKTLQFASGVKVVNNLIGQQELWVLTSSFQRVMTGTISSDEINYRIHTEKIPILLGTTKCLSPIDQHTKYKRTHASHIDTEDKKLCKYV